jgi:hypothetical protein
LTPLLERGSISTHSELHAQSNVLHQVPEVDRSYKIASIDNGYNAFITGLPGQHSARFIAGRNGNSTDIGQHDFTGSDMAPRRSVDAPDLTKTHHTQETGPFHDREFRQAARQHHPVNDILQTSTRRYGDHMKVHDVPDRDTLQGIADEDLLIGCPRRASQEESNEHVPDAPDEITEGKYVEKTQKNDE